MTLISSHSNSLLAGLRSLWKLDGNTNDSYGLNSYSYDYPYTAGLHGAQALDLFTAGISNGLHSNTNNTLPQFKSARTMNVWFKNFTPAINGVRTIAGYGGDSYGQLFVIALGNDGKLFFWGSTTNATGNAVINHSQWNMATVTYDGVNLRMYLNGVLDTITALNLNTIEFGVMFGYGVTFDNGDGLIQDFGIWGRVLTPKEINTLYNGGLGVDITAIPIEENLLTSTSKGTALRLKGNQHVRIPEHSSLRLVNDLTIKARIKINNNLNTVYGVIISRGGGYTYNMQWLLLIEVGGIPLFYVGNGTSVTPVPSDTSAALKVGVWYDIIATIDAGIAKLSINYEPYTVRTAPVPLLDYTVADGYPIGIGAYPEDFGDGYNFQGDIDSIKIWNKGMTLAQALADNNTPDTVGLVADYQFEDNAVCSNNSAINGQIMNRVGVIEPKPVFVGSASPYANNKNNTIDLNGRNAYFQIPLVGIRSMTFMYNGDIAHKGYLLDMRPAFFAWLYWGSYNAGNIPVVKVNNVNVSGTIASVWNALNTNKWNHVYLEFSSPVTSNIFVGSRYTADETMYASFKDISIFNNTLTAQEVTDLYSGNTTTTTSKLVKHYDLTIVDNLTLVNTTIQAQKLITSNTLKAKAFSLEGNKDSYIRVGYKPALQNAAFTVTMKLWLRDINTPDPQYLFTNVPNDHTPGQFGLAIVGTLLRFYLTRPNGEGVQTPTISLLKGYEHKIACTYNGSVAQLYVDGIMFEITTDVNTNVSNPYDFLIGVLGYSPYDFPTNGVIKDFALWNTVLAGWQITGIHNSNLINMTVEEKANMVLGIGAYDDGTIVDVSPNNFSLTLNKVRINSII
jgi:hypothetical protein